MSAQRPFDKHDYTGIFTPLSNGNPHKYPLYEYSRGSETVLSAVMNALVHSGATEDEAIAFMQLKALRHMFDYGLEEVIAKAAFLHVRKCAQAELQANSEAMRELVQTNKPFRLFDRNVTEAV